MLLLGDFTFQNFEIPQDIDFGTRQMVKVHETMGGDRTVDALGPSPHPIRWFGWFQGAGAADRARQLDYLAQQGGQLVLVWNDEARSVIIADLEFKYERTYQVHYRICCEVVSMDGSSGLPSVTGAASPTLDALVSGDVATVQGNLGNVAPSLSAPVTTLATAVASGYPLQGQFGSTLAPITTAANAAISAFSGRAATLNGLLDPSNFLSISPSTAPPALPGLMGAQAAALLEASYVNTAENYLSRIGINIAQATG